MPASENNANVMVCVCVRMRKIYINIVVVFSDLQNMVKVMMCFCPRMRNAFFPRQTTLYTHNGLFCPRLRDVVKVMAFYHRIRKRHKVIVFVVPGTKHVIQLMVSVSPAQTKHVNVMVNCPRIRNRYKE